MRRGQVWLLCVPREAVPHRAWGLNWEQEELPYCKAAAEDVFCVIVATSAAFVL